MLAENTKSTFVVGGRLNPTLQGPHFPLSPMDTDRNESSQAVVNGAMELRGAMQLSLHPSLREFSSAVQFCYRDGCMTMAGILPSYFLKQLAQEAIRNLEGVETIDNRICVPVSCDSTDSTLLESVGDVRTATDGRSGSDSSVRVVPR